MEKPEEGASLSEIAQWLESNYWSSFADGIEVDGDEDEE